MSSRTLHFIATYWMPTAEHSQGATLEQMADGYGYDVRVLPCKNVMLISSFTGWSNYMMDFGKMLQDKEAMKRFGQTVVVWNLHTRQPKKVLHVPGAPLEIRFAWGARHNYAFTTSALTSKIWLLYEDDSGEWQAKAVANIGDPSKVPLPEDQKLYCTLTANTHYARGVAHAALGEVAQAEAEAVFREDLGLGGRLSRATQHPDNVWSLKGLYDCLEARGEEVEIIQLKQRLDLANARADRAAAAPCFCAQAAMADADCCG